MKRPRASCVALLCFLCGANGLFGESAEERRYSWYAAINPVALVVPICGYGSGIVQFLTAEEIGLALSLGRFVARTLAVEGRVSFGMPNSLELLTLGGVSAKWFPFSRSSARAGGFFLGPDLRIGNTFYLTTSQSYTNIVPSADVGWMFVLGRVVLNARIVQSICVATIPSDPLVAPACAWCFSPEPSLSPVLPVFSFDVGFSF